MNDLVIIGGGPAASAAAVYAARKQLKTTLVTKDFGGQSVVSPDIHNWIGETSISGEDLGKKLENHVSHHEGPNFSVKKGVLAQEIKKIADNSFEVVLDNDETIKTKAILITSGSQRRQLEVPGAAEFENKGLVYCASCDGPLFSGMNVVVIGGGNAGFEAAAQLLAYCQSVTLIHRYDTYKADPITVEKVLAHPKMKSVLNVEPVAVLGENFVSGLTYRHKETGAETTIDVNGVFVEIGAIPNTDFTKGLIDLDNKGYIEIDPWTQKTSQAGIWAAGDCTNVKYHQNNIAAGDAVKAVEDIYSTLNA